MFNPCISLNRSVTPIFYIIFLFFYMFYMSYQKITKKLFLELQLCYYFLRILPKKTDV